MERQTNIDRLCGYLIKLGVFAIAAWFCWYFRSVLLYVVLAFVVSLIGRPLVRVMRKVRIKGHSAPDWLLAILSLIIIIAGLGFVVTQIIPVVAGIIRDASLLSGDRLPAGSLVESINGWVVNLVPGLGQDFDAVGKLLEYLKNLSSDFSISGAIGSVVGAVANLAVGAFAVIFISFFFIKDEDLFSNIIAALVPDRIERSVRDAVDDVDHLLSRYFIGLIIEMAGVALVDFLGLWAVARIGFGYALGIGFIAGLLNIIPYVGPLIGEVLGVLLCVVLKYGAGVGLDVNIWIFALVVLAIMLGAQLIDNTILQPLIYSSSIQAKPLEIFIVILIASQIGGTLGTLAAIPAYTVVRVIAIRFYHDKKAVRRLIPDIEDTD